jgi:carbon-monoxide dehydrogenase large subunit
LAFVAMRIQHPVKWVESRRDGTMLGLKLKIIQDLGAYHQLLTAAIPTLSVLMMPGLYKFKNVSADIVGAFTNCVPTDAYRGAGRPEATHGIERMVDILAAELKMDPAEIRLKNFVQPNEFPYATATGLSYGSGNYAAPLKEALSQVNYAALRREQQEARGAGRLMGIGISTYGEICARGPRRRCPRADGKARR